MEAKQKFLNLVEIQMEVTTNSILQQDWIREWESRKNYGKWKKMIRKFLNSQIIFNLG
jgi:hypothetical protein